MAPLGGRLSVDRGTKLAVTKTISNGFRYVSYRDKGRWVKNKYLSDTKPNAESSASSSGGGISGAPCPGRILGRVGPHA